MVCDYDFLIYRKKIIMEYQSNLNQYGISYGNSYNSNYSDNYYNSYDNGYQTRLSDFDNNFSSSYGLYPNTTYGQFSTGGNLHDTFKFDRYDNIYGGHTTLDLGNNQKIHMPWDNYY